ncbi:MULTISPECIES: hypothetical protein [unclassified Exiguobacterium]|uniref:SH3 domain-containing protein n=1 Tax=unclassified Exiguobacterium TaxID=2644629 RepID=UPI001BECA7E9|nr:MULTISPECIES: hypothetical protein [unclassified Exiguobacterium]
MKHVKVLTSSLLAVALMVSPSVDGLTKNDVSVEASATTSFVAKQNTKIFKSKHQKSSVLLSIKKGTAFKTVKKIGSWSEVTIGSKKGYVPSADIQSLSNVTTNNVKKKTNRITDLKASRSSKAKTIVRISTGKEVTELKRIGSWTEISYGKYRGYVPARNLSSIEYVKTTTNRTTNLKASRSSKAKTTLRISTGKEVSVVKQWGSWTEVYYGKSKGFVPTRNLNAFKAPSGSIVPPAKPVDNGKMRSISQINAYLKAAKHPEDSTSPMFTERSHYGERVFGYKGSASKKEQVTISALGEENREYIYLSFGASEVYAMDDENSEKNFKIVLRSIADSIYPKGSKNADIYYDFLVKQLEMIVNHYDKYNGTSKALDEIERATLKIDDDVYSYHNAVLSLQIILDKR